MVGLGVVVLHFDFLGRDEVLAVQLVEVVDLFNHVVSGFPMYRMTVCSKMPPLRVGSDTVTLVLPFWWAPVYDPVRSVLDRVRGVAHGRSTYR